MPQLEFEFRVYRTLEKDGKRECVVARSVPHALQVWGESHQAIDRSLELVISGNWLMQFLEQTDSAERQLPTEIDECARIKIAETCIDGLLTQDPAVKQRCIEEVLVALGYDPVEIRAQYESQAD